MKEKHDEIVELLQVAVKKAEALPTEGIEKLRSLFGNNQGKQKFEELLHEVEAIQKNLVDKISEIYERSESADEPKPTCTACKDCKKQNGLEQPDEEKIAFAFGSNLKDKELQYLREKALGMTSLLYFDIKKVIFTGNKTIVLFEDGTKQTAVCCEGDVYDREKAVMVCLFKRIYGKQIKKLFSYLEDEIELAENDKSSVVIIAKPKTKKVNAEKAEEPSEE